MLLRDDAVLLDILRAAELAHSFAEGMTREAFDLDAKTQSAVEHQLPLLGEGVRRLSDDLQEAHPEIPWRKIAGMRNHLIHEYDDVDLGEVWRTATVDVPILIQQLRKIAPL